MTKYSLFQFKDGRKLKVLILTKDVKGFEPSCADDIPNREFLVKWQESYHDDDADHDGYYPGRVLLVGATVEEVRMKAKELKIRLPMTFPLQDNTVCKPMSEPLKKPRKKRSDEDPEVVARKRRMNETSKLLDEVKLDNQSAKKVPEGNESSITAKAQTTGVRTGEERNGDKRIKSSSYKSGRSTAAKELWSEGRDCPKVTKDHATKPKANEKLHDLNSSVQSPKKPEPHITIHDHSQSVGKNVAADMEVPNEREDWKSNEQEDATVLSPVENRICEDVSETGAQVDNESVPTGSKSKKIRSCSKKVYYKSSKCSDSSSLVSNSDEDPDDATVQLAELKKQFSQSSLRIEELEEKVKNQRSNLKTYQKEIEKKRQIISNLKSEVEDLKSLNLSLQRQLLVSGPKEVLPLKSSSPISFKSSPVKSGKSSPLLWSPYQTGSSPPQETKSSPAAALDKIVSAKKSLFDSDKSDDTSSETSDVEPCNVRKTPVTVKHESKIVQSPFKNDIESKEGEDKQRDKGTKEKLREVSKRIFDDLKGVKPLECENDQVHVGMGLKINKQTWEKVLRKRKDDSKFFKDCAGIIWGKEALKQRTGMRCTGDKKACTPKKVKLCKAMLTGKMLARGESHQQQEFILANFAPKWLTDKCYDAGRQPRQGKDKK
ncbi:hypothetical protein ONE63_011283 [Megalurothrips usitatus]|uniref:Uncharacterized protein n=1 Tax=Megalurothrips usitatus TaxID=439358 RepID=A0AAV7WZJ4_9NEOP|nr:hypothetical protein ONE63_011283 [Megalurothrips usitatus]